MKNCVSVAVGVVLALAAVAALVGVVGAAGTENGEEITLSQLKAWLEDNGAMLSKLEFGTAAWDEDERAVFCTEPIAEGEIAMMIPQSLLMTVGTAYESSIRDRLRILKDLGTGLDDEDILVLHLLSERKKGADSKWYPFIKTLPKAFPKVSFASLSSGAAAADGGPSPMDRAEGPIVSLVRERIDTLNRMDKLLSESWMNQFTRADVDWGYAALHSRAWDLKELGPTLLPGLDLINHEGDNPHGVIRTHSAASLANAGIEVPATMSDAAGDDAKVVVVVSTRDCGPGDEYMASYGTKAGADLMAYFGFIIPDQALFNLKPFFGLINFEKERQRDVVSGLLRRADCFDTSFYADPRGTTPADMMGDRFLNCVKLLQMSRAEHLVVKDASDSEIRDGAYLDGAVSKESQAQSLRLMAGLMEDMKTWYRYAFDQPVAGGDYQPLLTNVGGGTMDEDLALLDDSQGGLSAMDKNMLALKVSERRALTVFAQALSDLADEYDAGANGSAAKEEL